MGAQRVTSSPPCYPQEANCDPSSQPTPRPHLVTCVRVLKSRERMDRSTSIQPMYWGERVVSQQVSQPRSWIPAENLIVSPALQSSPSSLTSGPDVLDPPSPTDQSLNPKLSSASRLSGGMVARAFAESRHHPQTRSRQEPSGWQRCEHQPNTFHRNLVAVCSSVDRALTQYVLGPGLCPKHPMNVMRWHTPDHNARGRERVRS